MSSGIMNPAPANTIEDWSLIEPLCVAFEEAWHKGECPALEDYLELGADLPRPLLLEELLRIELFYKRAAGQSVDGHAYQSRFPNACSLIQRVLASEPRLPTRNDFLPQAIIERYKIVRELGRGSFAVVYLAHDDQLGREVAIKVPGDGQRASSQQLVRLLEEVRAAARLRHPGIVAIYDVQPLADGGVFAVLEYVEGTTLSKCDWSQRSYVQIGKLFAEIADAVAYAHSHGFVHRDLHPDNILIDDKGSPHVLDFGLAVHDDDQRALAGERAGSLFYMSPEQARGETHRLDGRADIWAIGACLYEVLTGRRPFAGESQKQIIDEILNRNPKPPRQIESKIPAELERICLRCLAKSPEDRFATAGDFANELRVATSPRGRRATRRVIVFTIMLLILLGPAAWLLATYLNGRPAGADAIQIDVMVWKNGQWHGVQKSPNMLPLRNGDQLRIHAKSARPRYMYIVWIDAAGNASAVYPWSRGDWQTRIAERMRSSASLPDGSPDEVWPMRVQRSGCEALLLLARATPLPSAIDLAERLQSLPQLAEDSNTASGARLDYLQLLPLSSHRALDLKNVDRIDSPVVRFQCALKERLEPLFPEMECLVIPVAQ